jgi:hypothetical protein
LIVLQHLKDPIGALKEIYRVLKPGGVVGVREEDRGSSVIAPHMPLIEQSLELYYRLWRRNGGDPNNGRNHRSQLRQAGFTDIRASASAFCRGNPEETSSMGVSFSNRFLEASFTDQVIDLGWTDRATLEKMSTAWREWGGHPDAYVALVWCEAVGWKE